MQYEKLAAIAGDSLWMYIVNYFVYYYEININDSAVLNSLVEARNMPIFLFN